MQQKTDPTHAAFIKAVNENDGNKIYDLFLKVPLGLRLNACITAINQKGWELGESIVRSMLATYSFCSNDFNLKCWAFIVPKYLAESGLPKNGLMHDIMFNYAIEESTAKGENEKASVYAAYGAAYFKREGDLDAAESYMGASRYFQNKIQYIKNPFWVEKEEDKSGDADKGRG